MTLTATDDVGVLQAAADWVQEGHAVALATVLATWGSAPRGVGSHLAIRADGLFVGSVSGGCVERAVVELGQRLIGTGGAEIVEFGVSNEDAWELGLACGGTICVGVTDLRLIEGEDLGQLAARTRAREAAALSLCFEPGAPAAAARFADDWHEVPALDEARRRARALIQPDPERPLFHRVYAPPLRILVIGAVHITRALAPMAAIAGHEVIIVDPRRAFAAPELWPEVKLVHDYPDEAFDALGLDRRCAVVALTHDPKVDDPGLESALRSEAFYIGALGSKSSHQKRLVRLAEAGLDDTSLARIHGPVGLSIGAATPAEVALAILAEITAVLRRAPEAVAVEARA